MTAGPEGLSTTRLTVGDADGHIASRTLTIEATGGSGITVPGRGFLLTDDVTDFDVTAPVGQPTANLPAPGKRPRSSMAPTIVLADGEPLLALGAPGGSTIITTVLQTLLHRIDVNQDPAAAIAAPRATPRNTATTQAEPALLQRYGPALEALGHRFTATPRSAPPPASSSCRRTAARRRRAGPPWRWERRRRAGGAPAAAGCPPVAAPGHRPLASAP